MGRKKKGRTYVNIFTGEVITEKRRKLRKDEYVDPLTGKVKRRKKKKDIRFW